MSHPTTAFAPLYLRHQRFVGYLRLIHIAARSGTETWHSCCCRCYNTSKLQPLNSIELHASHVAMTTDITSQHIHGATADHYNLQSISSGFPLMTNIFALFDADPSRDVWLRTDSIYHLRCLCCHTNLLHSSDGTVIQRHVKTYTGKS